MPTLRKVPAIAVAVVADERIDVLALGSIEHEPNPDLLCWEIGSITKVMTSILLADASLRGEVTLDDPIGRYLPSEVTQRLPAEAQQPRLVDLATHRAGFPGLPLPILRKAWRSNDPYSELSEADVFACLGRRTVRPKRSRHRYSNFGVGLLGHLLEAACAAPYAELLTQRLLTPLGMVSTGVGNLPVVPGFRKRAQTPPWTMGALQGAGAVRSTVADLVRFVRANLDPPPGALGDALRLAATPVHEDRGPRGGSGLGWMIRVRPGRKNSPAIWHNGGTYGGSSFMAIDPATRVAVISLGNAGPRFVPPLDGPSWKIFDLITG